MEGTDNFAKRKQPDEPHGRPPQPVFKRQRKQAPEDFELEPDDTELRNAEFLTQSQVKEDLLEEAMLLGIPSKFDDDPNIEKDENFSDAQADSLSDVEAEQSIKPQVEVIDVDALESQPSTNEITATPKPTNFVLYRPIPWGLEQARAHEQRRLLAKFKAHPEFSEAFRTQSWLDPAEEQQQGSLWSQIRKDHLKSLLVDPRFVLRSAQVERDDFLKAYMRLHHFAHADRLSDLLGPASRPSEYCQFLLNFMLDLYNKAEVRTKIGQTRCYVAHRTLLVNHDGYYPDHDPIIRRLDSLERKKKQTREVADASSSLDRKGDTYQEELIHLAEERLVDESDQEEPEETRYKSQRLQLQDKEMDQLCDFASYILRSYIYNVSGETFYSADEFAKYSQEQGLSFLDAAQADVEHHFDRLKWLNEPVLAPTLGRAKTIKEPLQLWQHAINSFSVKNLARCALIQSDSLLDWLEHVTRLKNNPSSLEEFYASERPVVCFAPVALLYLADTAIDFALEVLRAAISFAEKDDLYEEATEKAHEEMKELDDEDVDSKLAESGETSEELSTLIERVDIHRAASCKYMKSAQASSFILNQILQIGPLPDGSPNPRWFEAEWSQRKVRPYTASTEFELCSRDPAVKVTVPDSAMIETRAILMGINSFHHMLLYTKGSGLSGVPKKLRKSLSSEEARRFTKEAHESWKKASGGRNVPKKVETVSAEKEAIRPARTDLVPSEKGQAVLKQTEGTNVHKVKEVENAARENGEAKGKEQRNEPQISDEGVRSKDNETTGNEQVVSKLVPEMMDLDMMNQSKTSTQEAIAKNEDMAGPEETSNTRKSGEGVTGKASEENASKDIQSETKPTTDIIINSEAKKIPSSGIERRPVMGPSSQNMCEAFSKDTTSKQEMKGDEAVNSAPKPPLQDERESFTEDATSGGKNERKEKYSTFFGVANLAEGILASVGLKEWRSIKFEDMKATLAKLKGESTTDDEQTSTEDGEEDGLLRHRASSICYNRLRWIVLHALGINMEEKLSAEKPLGYASTANYANFRQFRSKKPLAIADDAFFLLAQLTEQFVRCEAEILMECAAHDDGRPWIDRADVALVHAVRKKDFPYKTL